MSNTTIGGIIPRADIIEHGTRLGSEIKNIRLSDELSDEAVQAISRLLLAHKVIFFRDQAHLDDAERQRFAVRLGSLRPRSTVHAIREAPFAMAWVGGSRSADQMHMGVSVGETCSKSSVLPDGGDIVWSSAAAAYLDLPEPLRMLADDLWAARYSDHDCAVTGCVEETDRLHLDDVFTGTIYEAAHPVVCVHPETGERMLVLGHFAQYFVGLQKPTSERLFNLLQSYLTAPENTVRWSWKSGDVAIWDSRATVYHAVKYSGGQDSTLSRLISDDDAPLGNAGRLTAHIKESKRQAARAA
ncbi:alpha-ketoglutarate-dependent taurine dioxygenase [Bradyrhizobium sp. USDA 4524]|uniref:TauD/TfdA dioxygenase family protein n=1 Tax=unclassified Bradyrhizobium TaxID=2631580 RepID=UPI00209EEADD|nr:MULTISPECIES: TauD/TfdA family dioxygenase [unclassified Bradyrhizobium]MCP1838699.1 taurine dioxygenase [Bradyrhizobium sp. USDA 4538]MCP1899265.1 taurine dioxygenase [Bradyrhizobium sp. USDA 4537]MCP1986623.1 taurine dioxygenase [Bradyrhizobium sp. USDA 4539]